MKKFLLLAAVAATFAASAQVPAEMEYLNELTSTENIPARLDNRQGFGMNGQFVVNDKAQGKINFHDINTGDVLSSLNTGSTASFPAVTKDEAGNILVRVDNNWPNGFLADTTVIKIFPADGSDAIDLPMPEAFFDTEENGRLDFFGFAEGNVMDEDEGGALYIITANSTGVFKVPIIGGEIDEDHAALYPITGAAMSPTTSTVVNPYTAADGTRHYMLWTRNANPIDMVLNENEDGFEATTFSLPDKGATNGVFPLTLGGYDLVIYTTLPNYANAWAIAEKNANEAIAKVDLIEPYVTNGIQANWLNAEVAEGSETKATIYQYFPGNYFKTFEFKLKSTITGVENIAVKDVKTVRYYNLQGIESATPFDGVNIVVKEMTDGSKVASKVVK